MVITSTAKRFPGTVVLPDALTFPQLIAAQDAFEAAREYQDGNVSRWQRALLPGVLACVSEWHIEGVPESPTAENFPATPRKDVSVLFGAILAGILTLVQGENELPPD